MTEKIKVKGMEELMFALRMAIAVAGSQSAYARKIGVSSPYLSAVLNQRKIPGPKILDDLRFHKVKHVGYERKQDAA